MDKRLVLTGQEGLFSAGPGPYVVPAIELPCPKRDEYMPVEDEELDSLYPIRALDGDNFKQ